MSDQPVSVKKVSRRHSVKPWAFFVIDLFATCGVVALCEQLGRWALIPIAVVFILLCLLFREAMAAHNDGSSTTDGEL